MSSLQCRAQVGSPYVAFWPIGAINRLPKAGRAGDQLDTHLVCRAESRFCPQTIPATVTL